jgi:RNA polymerase sigma factor (sigma-70 family)
MTSLFLWPMNTNGDYTQFVVKAQQGDRAALNGLADLVKPRLQEYVVRMTLDTHLAQDMVQESLLTMVQNFDSLREPEKFWFWLSRIALHKVRAHYRRNWRRSSLLSQFQPRQAAGGVQDAVAEVIGQEIKQIVLSAMAHLPPEYRAILAMRCYDQLTFPQISQQLGCRELKARALFSRAKRALGKNLTKNGLGKASLLGALVIFGKFTAVTEAAVTDISVAASTLKIGVLPALMVALSSRMAVTLVATAGVLTAAVPLVSQIAHYNGNDTIDTPSLQVSMGFQGSKMPLEYQYYYPPGDQDVVHIQTRASEENTRSDWRWLQNANANYWCNGNQVFIKNAHMFSSDLAVLRLPTDSSEMKALLDRVESRQTSTQAVRSTRSGLLIITGTNDNGPFTHVRSDYDISDEQVFQNPWPNDMKVIDERDALHQQGWCYFRITGDVKGKQILGAGRIPFVLSKHTEHFPWLRLSVENAMVLEDDPAGARISGGTGTMRAGYASGTFLRGLSRPWEGLHTVDTIRRDVAKQRLWFETQSISRTQEVTVTVIHHGFKIVYTIDMKTDLVRQIHFFKDKSEQGRLSVEYLKDVKGSTGVIEPKLPRRRPARHKRLDTLWMLDLVKGAWD